MLSHERIWIAIDLLAARHSLSPSALARKAGLDPTTFNKSKRLAVDGRPRWPSTESLAKVMDATGTRMDEFSALMGESTPRPPRTEEAPRRGIPLIGFAEAGSGGYFDNGGFPVGQGWDEIHLPGAEDHLYALEVSGHSMLPLYRDGDVVVVSPGTAVRRGDRVVARTREGEVMVKILQRRTARRIELASVNPEFADRHFAVDEIDWMARILWASQ